MKIPIGIIAASISRQKIAQEAQENQLALYTSHHFVQRIRPIFKDLSERSARTYISYLQEAQEMILQGESEENTYNFFCMRLCRLNPNFRGGKSNETH